MVTVVLPLRTRRVLRVALRDHIQALARLVDRATDCLLAQEHETEGTLRADARAVDATYQALIATAQPLQRNLFGSRDEDTAAVVRLASASRNYGRNLVGDVDGVGPLDTETSLDVARARATLRQSMDTVAEALNGPRDVTYTRSSALFDLAERRLQERTTLERGPLVLRDLKLIDGAMAGIAEVIGLSITDHDTVAIGQGRRPGQLRSARVLDASSSAN